MKRGTRARSLRRSRLANPRFYLRALFLAVGLAFFVMPYAVDALNLVVAPKSEDGCRVVRVVDGDTVTLWCPGGAGAERARIVGVDTPEKYSAGCPSEAAKALAAEWYLRGLLATGDTLVVQGDGRDRYDRRLVRLFVDQENVARLIVDAGHGRPYRGGARKGWCG